MMDAANLLIEGAKQWNEGQPERHQVSMADQLTMVSKWIGKLQAMTETQRAAFFLALRNYKDLDDPEEGGLGGFWSQVKGWGLDITDTFKRQMQLDIKDFETDIYDLTGFQYIDTPSMGAITPVPTTDPFAYTKSQPVFNMMADVIEGLSRGNQTDAQTGRTIPFSLMDAEDFALFGQKLAEAVKTAIEGPEITPRLVPEEGAVRKLVAEALANDPDGGIIQLQLGLDVESANLSELFRLWMAQGNDFVDLYKKSMSGFSRIVPPGSVVRHADPFHDPRDPYRMGSLLNPPTAESIGALTEGFTPWDAMAMDTGADVMRPPWRNTGMGNPWLSPTQTTTPEGAMANPWWDDVIRPKVHAAIQLTADLRVTTDDKLRADIIEDAEKEITDKTIEAIVNVLERGDLSIDVISSTA